MAVGSVLRRVSTWLERLVLRPRRVLRRDAATERLAAADARLERLLANPALRAIDAEQRTAMRDLRASLRDLRSSSMFPPDPAAEEGSSQP